MAFQRIRIKNTNVSGKIPGADKLDTAELCINLKDHKLFSKDADGNVFEISGDGKVESGPTPPISGNETGDLFWDGDFLLVWNGSEWVPVGQSDLDYTPAADGGTITNTNGDDAELPLVDGTNAGLMSPEDYKKLGDMPEFIVGDNPPGSPILGDIWVDTSECPPTINVWNDCNDPGNPSWTPIGGGSIKSDLKVGKGVITPNVDVEVGDTLTGSATVTDAVGAVTEVHVWELDGSEAQRGSNDTYTAEEGVVRYRKEVTDEATTVIGDWSDPVTVTAPTGPNATMHGLRFDSARSTKLTRSGSGTGTISYWKKDSSTGWVWRHVHQTGTAYPAEIGAGYDGYMSDYYFVDGQDLSAETFVGQFDGKTGPLDSSDVIANVGSFGTNGFYLPFDPTNDIGNDASGQGNNFAPENFTLEYFETTETFDVYSKATNTGASSPVNITDLTLRASDQHNWEGPGNTVNHLTADFKAVGTYAATSGIVVATQSTVRTYISDDGTNWTQITTNLVSVFTGRYIQWVRTDTGYGDDWGISSEDSGTQDPVLDTPINNYAVLDSGKNGNLEATADGTNLTYVGEAGTDYYYEADGVGATHTGGSTFSSTDGVAYNFGQQPFVGTPTVEGRLYQTWQQYIRTPLGYTQDELAKATQKLAEQEPYVQLMRSLIREWQPGSTYSYGDIVQLNGMTYQAEANDVKLIAPNEVSDTGTDVLWRPLVRVAPAKTLSDVLPEPEQPTVLPAPDEEPPKKTNRRRKKS